MPSKSPSSKLWQAKFPILMACAVALLVVLALRANDRRQCKAVCVQHAFADGIYTREWFFEGQCQCVTRDGKRVPAPQAGR
jgi:hypothetical protein